MKIVDLTVADIQATELKRKLNFEQKQLLLELGNEVYSLEISDITDTSFYLRIETESEYKTDYQLKVIKTLQKYYNRIKRVCDEYNFSVEKDIRNTSKLFLIKELAKELGVDLE